MAFKQREKRRRARMAEAAQNRARKQQRETKKKSQAWWLTLVTRDTCCAECAGMLRVGRPMVYCASPREALCEPCAESRGVKFRPSRAWEQSRWKAKK